jgi:hypothetical protein
VRGYQSRDALREAISSNEHAAFSVAKEIHLVLAFVCGDLTCNHADGDILEFAFELATKVVRRRDVAAKHNRVESFSDELCEVVREDFQLWIAGLARQALGLSNEVRKGRVVRSRRRLDVVVRQQVGGAVEDAALQAFDVRIYLDAGSRS